MKENTWSAVRTARTVGTTSKLGSPRSWLRRAYDVPSLADIVFEPGSLTPGSITVAGIWYRPAQLPQLTEHSLYRFFDLPPVDQIWNTRASGKTVPAVGVCAVVEFKNIMRTIKQFEAGGAEFTWWARPNAEAIPVSARKYKTKIDHDEVFKHLDAGLTRGEIGNLLDINPNNVDYIRRKWEKQKSGDKTAVKHQYIDKTALHQDLSAKCYTVGELAKKYECSPSYIYRYKHVNNL